jgi:hypothetical protein
MRFLIFVPKGKDARTPRIEWWVCADHTTVLVDGVPLGQPTRRIVMDEMTKQTWGIIIRTAIQWAAGAMGLATFFTPDLVNAAVTVALGAVGIGLSYMNKKKLVEESGL